eukprot:TRINITY_DN4697_c0_g2_i1.p1 TRINITY_DN4697_c0_g2~~TRINITY_DN4697_c0_g2_i1.p1  ORF type:complete len:339 (-),score=50.47 TRINITY_DN4697_c0_g2_i1:120-1136(-)
MDKASPIATEDASVCLLLGPTFEDEGASTDLGSVCSCCSSDADVSSVSSSVLCGRQRPSILDVIGGGAPISERRVGTSKKSDRSGYGVRGRRRFKGTPLETIPGTPVAKSGHLEQFLYGLPSADGNIPPLPFASAPVVETTMVSRDIPVKPPGVWTTSEVAWDKTVGGAVAKKPISRSISTESLCWPSHVSAREAAASSDSDTSAVSLASAPPLLYGRVSMASPLSPKRRAREATIARAKWQGLPLKVRPPSGCTDLEQRYNAAVAKGIDVAAPVKKRPVFAEVAGEAPAAALRNLQPGLPVKKVVPDFLVSRGSHLFPSLACFDAVHPACSTILSAR